MDVYDTMVTADQTLIEQIVAEVFDTLSESGPILNVMDRHGRCWSSHPNKLETLGLDQDLLGDLWAKVDDGAEPAVAHIGDTTVVGAQLATERTHYGYLLLAVSRGNAEWTPINFDLVEALFGQITLVFRLIEDKRHLDDTYAKSISIYGTAEAPAN